MPCCISFLILPLPLDHLSLSKPFLMDFHIPKSRSVNGSGMVLAKTKVSQASQNFVFRARYPGLQAPSCVMSETTRKNQSGRPAKLCECDLPWRLARRRSSLPPICFNNYVKLLEWTFVGKFFEWSKWKVKCIDGTLPVVPSPSPIIARIRSQWSTGLPWSSSSSTTISALLTYSMSTAITPLYAKGKNALSGPKSFFRTLQYPTRRRAAVQASYFSHRR
jgi:hypothetical protein